MSISAPAAKNSSPPAPRAAEPDYSGFLQHLDIKTASAFLRKHPDASLIIDVGSHNARMEAFVPGNPNPVARSKTTASLAEGTRRGHRQIRKSNEDQLIAWLEKTRPVIDLFTDVRAVYTSALRLVEHTQAGKKLIARIEEATGRKIKRLTGRDEATYNAQSVLSELKSLQRTDNTAFITFGGGSVQSGFIVKGEVVNPVSVPYGILTLIAESEDDVKKAGKILRQALPEAPEKIRTLYAGGGYSRALADMFTGPENAESPKAVVMSFREAEKKLLSVVKLGNEDCRDLYVKDRRLEEMAVAAKAILEAGKRYGAKEIVLGMATMRPAIAQDEGFHKTDVTPTAPAEIQSSSPGHSARPYLVSRRARGSRKSPAAIRA